MQSLQPITSSIKYWTESICSFITRGIVCTVISTEPCEVARASGVVHPVYSLLLLLAFASVLLFALQWVTKPTTNKEINIQILRAIRELRDSKMLLAQRNQTKEQEIPADEIHRNEREVLISQSTIALPVQTNENFEHNDEERPEFSSINRDSHVSSDQTENICRYDDRGVFIRSTENKPNTPINCEIDLLDAIKIVSHTPPETMKPISTINPVACSFPALRMVSATFIIETSDDISLPSKTMGSVISDTPIPVELTPEPTQAISRRQKVGIMEINGLDTKNIRPGQRLRTDKIGPGGFKRFY